jgi:DNA-binding NarL/FixJ family response regulator
VSGARKAELRIAAKRDVTEALRVALVSAAAQRQERIGAILEAEDELKLEHHHAAEDLIEGGSNPSLIMLWVESPLTGAVAAELAMLREAMERTPIVMVCSDLGPGDLRGALAAGASGVVLDRDLEVALGPCLHASLAAQICVPRQHSRQIEPAALSSREKQILGLVVMGYMNSQIAEQLFLAESTVKSHLSSAFAKLGVRSRNEAVDLILDPDRGLGLGILALGGEPLELVAAAI